MFGIKKRIIEENPEDHVNPFDKAKKRQDVFSELNKTGFEKFMEKQPVTDDVEETKKFIEYNYGLTIEKIIQDIESRIYSKGNKGVQKIYTSDVNPDDFNDFINSLNNHPWAIKIDENYPLMVSFSGKLRFKDSFGDKFIVLEMTVYAGEFHELDPATNKRYK